MEQILLETMLRHMENREVIRNIPHGITKGKLCLTNLDSSVKELQCWSIGEEQLMSSCLNLCRAFDTALNDILVSQLERHGFDRGTTQWIRNWMDGLTQRIVIITLMSKQRTVMSGVHQGPVSGLVLFNSF
ncbi:rna-directed dna polymerase from mobile element jockey-like [Pitangus sulphuratus]|nr:rna-directed dna polymerase from mobile element jockey-like [Pitangus sulphuratus]